MLRTYPFSLRKSKLGAERILIIWPISRRHAARCRPKKGDSSSRGFACLLLVLARVISLLVLGSAGESDCEQHKALHYEPFFSMSNEPSRPVC